MERTLRRVAASPKQSVFGFRSWCSARNPKNAGELFSDNPDPGSRAVRCCTTEAPDRAARVRTIARTKLMVHSNKLNASRALDTSPRVVPTFLPGNMVAIWRMMNGGGILWQASTSPMGTWNMYGRSAIKASPKQLRPSAREERHAWRLVETRLRTNLVNFEEFSGHPFEDVTNGERPPVDEEELADEETVLEPLPGPQEAHPVESRQRPRFLVKMLTECTVKSRKWGMVMGSFRVWTTRRHLETRTDTTEDVYPEVKRRETDAPAQAQPQAPGGIGDPPGRPFLRRHFPPLCAAAAGLVR